MNSINTYKRITIKFYFVRFTIHECVSNYLSLCFIIILLYKVSIHFITKKVASVCTYTIGVFEFNLYKRTLALLR